MANRTSIAPDSHTLEPANVISIPDPSPFDITDLSTAPMTVSEIDQRLDALNQIDSKIIQLLQLAADATETLQEGKTGGPLSNDNKESFNPSQTRSKFTEKIKSYYTTLEQTSIELRREIRLLNDASGTKVIPISVVPKVSGVGRVKEEYIWRSISEKKPEEAATQSLSTDSPDKMEIDIDEQNQTSTLGGLEVSTDEDELGKIKVITK